jgi:hypothetical protein
MEHPKIAVVGCGFVGSIFTTEFLKLMFAGKLPQDLIFIDSDVVEERNAANQNFRLVDAGKPKAKVLATIANENQRVGIAHQVRLTSENLDELLGGNTRLIIDGVDNLATRQLLWGHGLRSGVPVLHLGIALEGTGRVEWTHPEHDTFSLAPHRIVGQTVIEPASGVTPPCELVRMRGVGLNTAFAGALAAAIYFGFDPAAHLKGTSPERWLTEWNGTPSGYFPLEETWSQVSPPE